MLLLDPIQNYLGFSLLILYYLQQIYEKLKKIANNGNQKGNRKIIKFFF